MDKKLDKIKKKKEILQAAKDCLSKYGFDKTTLEDIGKLVGLNKASLYYYYKNKEEIFSEAILMEALEFTRQTERLIKDIPGFKDKVLAYLAERIKYFRAVVNLHNLSIEVVSNFQPMFHELYNKNVLDKEIGVVRDIIEEAMKKGEIVECDVERTAGSIFTVADAIKHKSLQMADIARISEEEFEKVVDDINFTISLLLDGLLI